MVGQILHHPTIIMRGIRVEPFLKYLLLLLYISGSCGTNTTTVSPTFSRTSTNRLGENVSTPPQQPSPTEAKEVLITETVDYTEIPENADAAATEIVNEAIGTTQSSDPGVFQTFQVSSVSADSVNNVVTTQTTVSTATETLSSRRVVSTANPSQQPPIQGTTLPFVAPQNENSPTVVSSSSKKLTTLSFDFSTTTTRATSQSSITTNGRTIPATSLPTTSNHRTSNSPTSGRVTELLIMEATNNATLTPSINNSKTTSIPISTETGVLSTSVPPNIPASTISRSTSPSGTSLSSNSPQGTTRAATTLLPTTNSSPTARATTTLLPTTASSSPPRATTTLLPTTSSKPSTSNSQTTSAPSTSRIQTTSIFTTRTPTQPTSTTAPTTRSITTSTTTLSTTTFNYATTTQTLQPTSTKTEQWSQLQSATPKSTSPLLLSTTTITLPNTSSNIGTSTDYLRTDTSDFSETTAWNEPTRNITVIYVDDDPGRDDMPLLLIVIAATVAVLVTLLLLFFLAILCIAKKREEHKNAKYYDYKKRWVKRAPRPKYEKVKVKQSYRHDREAAGSGWVFRDGADPSKQITLELRPRNAQPSPEDMLDNGDLTRRNYQDSFPPDMQSASPEVAVDMDADSIGSLRLSKSLDRMDTRSNSSEGDSGILALGDDMWSPTKGVPFHFISDDAVIEL